MILSYKWANCKTCWTLFTCFRTGKRFLKASADCVSNQDQPLIDQANNDIDSMCKKLSDLRKLGKVSVLKTSTEYIRMSQGKLITKCTCISIDIFYSPVNIWNTYISFLAHLSTKCSVSFCDLSMSVVRRPCVRASTISLNNISSETAYRILTKLHRNDPWVVPYQNCSNCSSWLHK